MNTLIIYDNTGYVVSQMAGSVREPQGGVQFLWIEIPEGQRLKTTKGIGVDVSTTPHQAILEKVISEKEIRAAEIEVQVYEILMEGGLL